MLLSLLFDAGHTVPTARIVSVAVAVDAGLWVFGTRLKDWAFHSLVLVGVAMVSIVVHQAGGALASAGYASLYLIVTVYACFFFTRPFALVHLVALVMPDCDAEQAQSIVDRLRETTPQRTSFSAGIATWDGDESITELVRRADEALYAAKGVGRARTVVSAT